MNILAASYHNIWPFADRRMSVFFHAWKYLIHAPIGTGKSFLFFDGPLYGLYKYQQRKMLNTHAKQWYIKLLFVLDQETYLVVRKLTPGKSKDSCQSTLYRVGHDTLSSWLQEHYGDVVLPDTDIQDILEKEWIQLEAIDYKNESDIQQLITSLLPPREVFTSTVFLMQDSDNVFELTPADRLNVLKNIFGLVDIDAAKDQIASEKKILQWQKNILQDTGKFNQSLQTHLQTYHKNLVQLSSSYDPDNTFTEYLREIEFLLEKAGIDSFDANTLDVWIHEKIAQAIEQKDDAYKALQIRIQTLQKSLDDTLQEERSLATDIQTIRKDISTLEEIIAKIDIQAFTAKKNALTELKNNQLALNTSIAHETIEQFANVNGEILWSYPQNPQVSDAYSYIQACISQGKVTQESIQSYETQQILLQKQLNDITNYQEQYTIKEWTTAWNDIQARIGEKKASITKDIAHLQDRITTYTTQKKDREQRLELLRQKWENTTMSTTTEKFLHELEAIVWKLSDAVHQRIVSLVSDTFGQEIKQEIEDERKAVEKKYTQWLTDNTITSYEEQLREKKQELTQLDDEPEKVLIDVFAQYAEKLKKHNEEYTQTKEQLNKLDDKQYKKQRAFLETLKSFLAQVDWKHIQSVSQKYNEYNEQIRIQEKDLQSLEAAITQWEETKQKLEWHRVRLEEKLQQQQKLKKNIEQWQTTLREEQNRMAAIHPTALTDHKKWIHDAVRSFEHIAQLVSDYADTKRKLKQLEEREWILGNLYQLFAKELLLVVLDENIPQLNSIVNAYLTNVVDYTLDMQVVQWSNNSVSLEMDIIDSKWKRDIKSLSGWQKTILKLVWMLAIAAHLRAPMLFLDETINNIDADTVGRVADLITDYIKKQDIKLYTVTHNEQIQTMHIWDQILSIDTLTS